MAMLCRLKSLFLKYWPCYLMAFLSIAVIKYRYSSVDVELLEWILAPTARWAGILAGASFPWQAGVGYVSHEYQFVIASTCSGIQFMMIVIAALVFGFVHNMGTLGKGMCWTVGSIGFSYIVTVLVNGVRIACAIFIPRRLPAAMLAGWMTPERFHTVIGIMVYFMSLLFIYDLAGALLQGMGILAEDPEEGRRAGIAVPVFWYFFVILGIPFLNRACERNQKGFTEYALLLAAVCPAAAGVYWLVRKLRMKIR